MTYILSPSAIKDQFDSNNRYKRMTILSGGDKICARFSFYLVLARFLGCEYI